jgi:branched-subunit amino acid ABC-type transport system permease component
MDLEYNKSMFLLLLMIFFTLFFIYFIIKYLNYLPHLWKNKGKEVSLLLVSLFVYSLFFLFWDSANVEFWIPQSIFMWLLIILFISEVHNKVEWKTNYNFLLCLLPIILFIINFNGSIKSAINP